MVKAYGATEVVPVTLREAAKSDLCTRALRWHRDGRVRDPRGVDGATLHRQAISLRRVVTEMNNVTFQFPRGASGHGDEFTALMLALRGAGEPPRVRGMGQRPALAIA